MQHYNKDDTKDSAEKKTEMAEIAIRGMRKQQRSASHGGVAAEGVSGASRAPASPNPSRVLSISFSFLSNFR